MRAQASDPVVHLLVARDDPAEANIFEFELVKGKTGLGFTIIGGTDQPKDDVDTGVYVTSITAQGAAASEGTLQVRAIHSSESESNSRSKTLDMRVFRDRIRRF